MTTMKDILKGLGIAIVAGLVAGLVAVWVLAPKALPSGNPDHIGAAGGMTAESYIPYVRYNSGYNSALDVKTSADLNTSGTLTVSGPATLTSSLTLGTNGTSLSGVKVGGCTIWSGSTTIGATSTGAVECQSATDGSLASGLTGVTTDAICTLTQASSTNSTAGGLVVNGVSASSTAGSIVARLLNLTGTTFTWSATASSSSQWKYSCQDPT